MPILRSRRQQPSPVSPQVPIPGEFPSIPQEVLDRFPSAKDWQTRLNEFWGRTSQAIQEAQKQTAAQANSQVVFTVDRFLIYANGVPTPMFALDDTGVRLGNVLVINTPGRKVYIGAGNYAAANTPFYVDTLGNFSLGDSFVWDAETDTLVVSGVIVADQLLVRGFDNSLITSDADYITWQGPSSVSNRGLYLQTNKANTDFAMLNYSALGPPGHSYIDGAVAGGDFGAMTATPSLASMGLRYWTFGGTTWALTGSALIGSTEAQTETARGSSLVIRLTPNGSASLAVAAEFTPTGLALANGVVLTFDTDTNLYRSAADTLKTDDSLIVVGAITHSGGGMDFRMTSAAGIAIFGTISNTPLDIYANNGLAIAVSTAQAIQMPSLAGVGTRNVVVDASGNLTAP